jgi:hypothetical protein
MLQVPLLKPTTCTTYVQWLHEYTTTFAAVRIRIQSELMFTLGPFNQMIGDRCPYLDPLCTSNIERLPTSLLNRPKASFWTVSAQRHKIP